MWPLAWLGAMERRLSANAGILTAFMCMDWGRWLKFIVASCLDVAKSSTEVSVAGLSLERGGSASGLEFYSVVNPSW